MTKTKLIVCALLAASIFNILQGKLTAQSDSSIDPGKSAQAKSQQEFDDYLGIVTATQPPLVIDRTDRCMRTNLPTISKVC
jgi:hypothetical protein